ncbi:MAG: hypothetical protein ACM34I_10670 [bacterium]
MASMDMEKEYSAFFGTFFDSVKEEHQTLTGSRQDDELSLSEQAFRNAVRALPCPVSIIRLRVNTRKYSEAKNPVYHLITFDFSRCGLSAVTYYGERDLDELDAHAGAWKEFDLNPQMLNELRTFRLGGYGSPNQWNWVWIVPYDILKHPGLYVEDFLASFQITFRNKIIKEFGEKTDFSKKYWLPHDPILHLHELQKRDDIFNSFVRVDKYGDRSELTIEDEQESISGIQLIPHVPEKITNIFRTAKKLYIFGFFEHAFFNIALHYAFLAMEAALRLRHRELFGESGDANRLDEIIRQLVEKGTIPKGEAKYYDARGEFRNALSYLAGTSLLTPIADTFERLAYQINVLYDMKKAKD